MHTISGGTTHRRDPPQATRLLLLRNSRHICLIPRRSQQIGAFPQSGRIVPEVEFPQIREVLEGPYRIIYHIKPDQVDIIAVIHGSQQTPWTAYATGKHRVHRQPMRSNAGLTRGEARTPTSVARATRGRRLPSLDARSGKSIQATISR